MKKRKRGRMDIAGYLEQVRHAYPPSPEVFRHVSEKGEQLRRLHLMEPAAIGDAPYPYVGEGDDIVASGFPKFEPNPPPLQGRGWGWGM
jgi:hypothetical protein